MNMPPAMETCPWCGRRVPTFPTLNHVLVFEGHRSRTRSLTSVGLAWCEGGGRKVPVVQGDVAGERLDELRQAIYELSDDYDPVVPQLWQRGLPHRSWTERFSNGLLDKLPWLAESLHPDQCVEDVSRAYETRVLLALDRWLPDHSVECDQGSTQRKCLRCDVLANVQVAFGFARPLSGGVVK